MNIEMSIREVLTYIKLNPPLTSQEIDISGIGKHAVIMIDPDSYWTISGDLVLDEVEDILTDYDIPQNIIPRYPDTSKMDPAKNYMELFDIYAPSIKSILEYTFDEIDEAFIVDDHSIDDYFSKDGKGLRYHLEFEVRKTEEWKKIKLNFEINDFRQHTPEELKGAVRRIISQMKDDPYFTRKG